MCGQVGVIFETRNRTREELNYLTGLFTQVLEMSEERGRHATGVAWLKSDGQHRISKLVIPAREFVQGESFAETMAGVDDTVTVLMGHTRWPTRGSVENIANAQPKRAGQVLGTHNGTVVNADILFKRFGLPRHAEVDSEVIFQLADKSIGENGRMNLSVLATWLSQCRGSVAAVMAPKTYPTRVVLVKGPNPLELALSKRHGAVLYASDKHYLKIVVGGDPDWKWAKIQDDALVCINTNTLRIAKVVLIRWQRYPG
jgi:amidophosphoribosyltransferase